MLWGNFKVRECPEFPSPRPGLGGQFTGLGMQFVIPKAMTDHSEKNRKPKQQTEKAPRAKSGGTRPKLSRLLPWWRHTGYAAFLQWSPVTTGVKCCPPGKPVRDFTFRVLIGGLVR